MVYDPASLPTVNVGTAVYFSALGYKEGLADSEVTACFREDNVQERPLDGPLRTVSYTWDNAGNRTIRGPGRSLG